MGATVETHTRHIAKLRDVEWHEVAEHPQPKPRRCWSNRKCVDYSPIGELFDSFLAGGSECLAADGVLEYVTTLQVKAREWGLPIRVLQSSKKNDHRVYLVREAGE